MRARYVQMNFDEIQGVTHERAIPRSVAVPPGGRHRGGMASARQPRDRAQPRSVGSVMSASKESPTPARRKRGRHGRTNHRQTSHKSKPRNPRNLTSLEDKLLRRGKITFDLASVRMNPHQKHLVRRAQQLAREFAAAS